MTNSTTSTTSSSSAHPGRDGMTLLKAVVRPAWRQQPRNFDFSIFAGRDFRALDFAWRDGRPARHQYDKNAMYVGAASSVVLGVGAPELVQRPLFDPRKAGLWHIASMQPPATLPPLPCPADDTPWQYTPLVLALIDLGYTLDISEAYIWPESHQILRPFYERVKALREQAQTPEALKAVKTMYTVTFGMLAHSIERPGSGYLYRPDWFFGLVAHAKAILFRQAWQVYARTGYAPSRISVDALYYPERLPDGALPVGKGIGQFKYQEVV